MMLIGVLRQESSGQLVEVELMKNDKEARRLTNSLYISNFSVA